MIEHAKIVFMTYLILNGYLYVTHMIGKSTRNIKLIEENN